MGIFTSGAMATVGSGSKYWKLDPKGVNVGYVLHPDLATILSAPKYGVFVGSGKPFNASWISIGAEDVGNELGEKAQAKAFIWMLVPKNAKDLSEGFETMLWECSKSHYETISTQVNEYGVPLQGMMLVLKKESNRWQLVANKPLKSKEVPAATLGAAWAELEAKGLGSPSSPAFDEKEFGKLVGLIESKQLQRKFLLERSQGKFKTWNELRQGFGLDPIPDGDGVTDEDVTEY